YAHERCAGCALRTTSGRRDQSSSASSLRAKTKSGKDRSSASRVDGTAAYRSARTWNYIQADVLDQGAPDVRIRSSNEASNEYQSYGAGPRQPRRQHRGRGRQGQKLRRNAGTAFHRL